MNKFNSDISVNIQYMFKTSLNAVSLCKIYEINLTAVYVTLFFMSYHVPKTWYFRH